MISFKNQLIDLYKSHYNKKKLCNDYIKSLQDISFSKIKLINNEYFTTDYWKGSDLSIIFNKKINIFDITQDINYEYYRTKIDYNKKNIIVFIDGVYNSLLSKLDNYMSLYVDLISSLITDNSTLSHILYSYIEKYIDKYDFFSILNNMFLKEGVCIHIPDNVSINEPIDIIYIYTNNFKCGLTNLKNIFILGEKSKLDIVERHITLDKNNYILNINNEVHAKQYSNFNIYKIKDHHATFAIIDNTFVDQQKKSNCNFYYFCFDGNFVRNNINIYQNGIESTTNLYGGTIFSNGCLDNNTNVVHNFPDCTSNQIFKSIYDRTSKGSFKGHIYVSKNAQNINSFQKSNNILNDKYCKVYVKPQLKIFADNVKCSHGCTVGDLDYNSLFYIKQRGFSFNKAKFILQNAFLQDVVQNITNDNISKDINKLILDNILIKN